MNAVEFSKAELRPTLNGLSLLLVLHFKVACWLLHIGEFGIFGLFICLWFIDAVSSSGYIALNGTKFSD